MHTCAKELFFLAKKVTFLKGFNKHTVEMNVGKKDVTNTFLQAPTAPSVLLSIVQFSSVLSGKQVLSDSFQSKNTRLVV